MKKLHLCECGNSVTRKWECGYDLSGTRMSSTPSVPDGHGSEEGCKSLALRGATSTRLRLFGPSDRMPTDECRSSPCPPAGISGPFHSRFAIWPKRLINTFRIRSATPSFSTRCNCPGFPFLRALQLLKFRERRCRESFRGLRILLAQLGDQLAKAA